jgi:hypothetical protein
MTVPVCPYCGSSAKLVDSTVIYRSAGDYGWSWVCERFPKCNAYVGCHPGTKKPLGRLADKELRKAKMAAHAAFDRLWKAKIALGSQKKRARGAGYQWLADQLGIPADQCHIGMFDAETCRRVVEICKPYLRSLP